MGKRYDGPVVWLPDEASYFAMPDDPKEHTFMPNSEIAKRPKLKWVAYNLDPNDPSGHFEYFGEHDLSSIEIRPKKDEA